VDTVDDAVASAESEWRAYGVSRQDRAVLAADLRLDLQSAVADGVSPEHILGVDVREFARRLADEAGVPRARPEYGRVVRTAMTGAVLGGCAGLIVLTLGHPLMVAWFDLPFRPPLWLAVVVYCGTITALAVSGAVIAVLTRLADLPRIRQTANGMILLLPAPGAFVTLITLWFAAEASHAVTPLLVVFEVALVVTAPVGAVLLARKWAVRDHGRPGHIGRPNDAAANSFLDGTLFTEQQ
jgi:hypothetical protein